MRAKDNATQVAQIKNIINEMGLIAAAPDEARKVLELKGKNNTSFGEL